MIRRWLGGEIRRAHVGLGLGFVEMTDTLVYSSVSIQFDHGMIVGIKSLIDSRLVSQSVDRQDHTLGKGSILVQNVSRGFQHHIESRNEHGTCGG